MITTFYDINFQKEMLSQFFYRVFEILVKWFLKNEMVLNNA